MNLKETIKGLLAKLGLTAEQLTKVSADIDAIPEPAPVIPPVNPVIPPAQPDIAAMVQQAVKAAVTPLENALADSEARHKAASDAATAAAAAARANEIKTLIDDAVKTGKIPADNAAKKTEWENQFKASFETAKFALEQIPSAPASGKTPDKPTDKTSKPGEARVGMASHIRSDKIADYVNSIPIAEAAKN